MSGIAIGEIIKNVLKWVWDHKELVLIILLLICLGVAAFIVYIKGLELDAARSNVAKYKNEDKILSQTLTDQNATIKHLHEVDLQRKKDLKKARNKAEEIKKTAAQKESDIEKTKVPEKCDASINWMKSEAPDFLKTVEELKKKEKGSG